MKKIDTRIKKFNHTPNYLFLGKFDDVISGPNVSTTTFDEVIEQVNRKILVKKNY